MGVSRKSWILAWLMPLILGLGACSADSNSATNSLNPSQTSNSEATPGSDESPSGEDGLIETPSTATTKTDELSLSGVLFYHRYTSYSSWDSNLFALDLGTGRLVQINSLWKTMISPMNAHVNAAGNEMVFMGSQSGLAENEWDVFLSKWTGKMWGEPINLTGPNGMRDEDPKFSPNGHTVTYKENGVMATIENDGTDKKLLTVGKPDSSMPFFTSDGQGLIFEREGSIWLQTRDGNESVLWSANPTSAYYPIGADDQRFLFTEVQLSQHDRTMWGYYDGRPAVPLFYSDNNCDNSDPYPYQLGRRYVFYVTGCAYIYKGGYNLALADLKTKKVYDMDSFNPETNSHQLELGPSWSGTAKFPTK